MTKNESGKRDARIDQIFEKAVNLAPRDRADYLEKTCPDDSPSIRAEVEKLLEVHEEMEGETDFLRDGPFFQQKPDTSLESPGAMIGDYKLLQQIGEGGFGVVYMAQQVQPVNRRVALKILKPGMDSRQVIARFEAERQALAMMDHPSIAKVYDAGTTNTGRPYFVMELVKGIPITKFCDEQRLSLDERLKLFVSICNAVQHAHQKGIIHRDIKPSNLLVSQYDGEAVPKVIDFGVAKAVNQQLTDKTMFTQFGQVIGTLEYMSPEQSEMNQLDVDTRSDIYSMGAVLYELLTGTTPIQRERFRQVAFDEMLRIIRDEEPPRPSVRLSSSEELAVVSEHRKIDAAKICRNVRGELDWIVMKSLDKQRSRRYETASALAHDVERFLNNDPVEAGPPSPTYQLRKFISKNRASLAVISGFVLMLCLGTVLVAWQTVRVNRADLALQRTKDTAENNRIRAEAAETNAAVQATAAKDTAAAQKRTAEALAREQRAFYFKKIALANKELRANNTTRVKQLLNDCPEAYRGWEWYYLNRLGQQDLFSLPHEDPVWCLAYSPDGKWLASAGDLDFDIHLWNMESRKVEKKFSGHSMSVSALAFTSDGKQLISSGGHVSINDQGELKIWEVDTGKCVFDNSKLPNGIHALSINEQGNLIAYVHGWYGIPGNNYVVTILDLATREAKWQLTGHTGPVMDLTFSPDGERLVTVGHKENSIRQDRPGEFRVWNVESGEEEVRKDGYFGPLNCVSYHPSGSVFVTGGADRTVRVWNVDSYEQRIKMSGHTDAVKRVAFLPDSRIVSAGADGSVKIWKVPNEQATVSLRGHEDLITSLVFDPSTNHIVTAGWGGSIRFWDPDDTDTLNLNGGGVQFNADGSLVATVDGGLRVYDVVSGLHLYTVLPDSVPEQSFCFSRDGKRLGIVNRREQEIWILDASNGRKLRSWSMPHQFGQALNFSPDGKLLASLGYAAEFGEPCEICIWQIETGELQKSFPGNTKENNKVGNICFTADGKRLATVCQDNTARVWSIDSGQELMRFEKHGEPVIKIALSDHDALAATASDDNTVRVWNVDTGEEIHVLVGHAQDAVSVAFSADGKRIVSGANDKTVRLWDVLSGDEIITLQSHASNIRGIDISSDNQTIAATSEDQRLKLWSSLPFDADLRAKRRAAKLVNRLAAKPRLTDAIIQSINDNQELDEITKKYAIEFAKRVQPTAHIKPACWVVGRADATQDEYETALQISIEIATNSPGDNEIKNQLGMAHFRAGNYQDAIELLRSTMPIYESRGVGTPWNLAFLAMAYEKTGDHENARATLEKLDKLLEPPPTDPVTRRPTRQDFSQIPIFQQWQREARALIDDGEK